MLLAILTDGAAPARSPAQPPDSLLGSISGGWAGERAGTVCITHKKTPAGPLRNSDQF